MMMVTNTRMPPMQLNSMIYKIPHMYVLHTCVVLQQETHNLLLFPELGVGVGLTVVSVTEMIHYRVNTASTVNRSTP